MADSQWQDEALNALVAEYEAASADMAQIALVQVTRRHYARYERNIEIVDADQAVACKKGCAYCCHLRVSVRAHEALHLAAALKELPPEQLQAKRQAIERNAQRIRAMSAEEHTRTPMRCAFLESDDACSVYTHRPSACRRYHSTSVAACKASFDKPDDLSSRIAISNKRVVASLTTELAFRKVLLEASHDTAAYELHTAVIEALDDPAGCAERWARGERTFVRALPGEAPESIALA